MALSEDFKAKKNRLDDKGNPVELDESVEVAENDSEEVLLKDTKNISDEVNLSVKKAVRSEVYLGQLEMLPREFCGEIDKLCEGSEHLACAFAILYREFGSDALQIVFDLRAVYEGDGQKVTASEIALIRGMFKIVLDYGANFNLKSDNVLFMFKNLVSSAGIRDYIELHYLIECANRLIEESVLCDCVAEALTLDWKSGELSHLLNNYDYWRIINGENDARKNFKKYLQPHLVVESKRKLLN